MLTCFFALFFCYLFIFYRNLRHPNILQYYGCCLDKKALVCFVFLFLRIFCSFFLFFFKILERCEGNLGDIMANLDNKTILDYAKGIASGIQYLHNENITHRDLKPANVLVCSLFLYLVTKKLILK